MKEITKQDVKNILYEIEYGNLETYVYNFDRKLVDKILCIYVDKLNYYINSIHSEIKEEIENIDLEELNNDY